VDYVAVLVAKREVDGFSAERLMTIHPPLNDRSGPPVLDYGRPEPRRSWHVVARDWLEEGIDQLGGPTFVCLMSALLFLVAGMTVGGAPGGIFVVVSGTFFQISLGCWSKTSRW
jgi:hypothetical protein